MVRCDAGRWIRELRRGVQPGHESVAEDVILHDVDFRGRHNLIVGLATTLLCMR